jgi:tetratricopeptide (TPR) repeat protein
MTDDRHFDQRDQKVLGPQTNVAGNLIYEPPPTLPIPHQIPAPPSDFTGRKVELEDLLANFDKGATITGLQGMGGIGKTALALVLAENLKDRFPDGQIFIELRGLSNNPVTPADAMAHVIRAYHPTAQIPEDLSSRGGLYRTILNGKHTLLLLDNAANREQVEMLLPPTGCAMLITSRQKFTLPGLKARNMELLPPADSRELLVSIADRIGDHADHLARLCGYLPIALRNAASLLAERIDVDVVEYAQKLKDATTRLDLVNATFSLSYELLPSNLQMQWSMLSVFPADFDRAGAAAVWEMDIDAGAKALSDLLKWSLVDFNPSDSRYRLHDLARDFAGTRLEALACTHAQCQCLHSEHYKNILFAANALYHRGGKSSIVSLMLLDREWTNIKAGQAWSEIIMNSQPNRSKPGVASTEWTVALRLANAYPNAGFLILDLRLLPREQIRWLETAIVAAKQLNDRRIECSHLGNLGLAYLDQGDSLQAIEFLVRSLAISREISDQCGECAALLNLGIAYKNVGDFHFAIKFYEQASPIARDIRDLRSEGAVLGNLGVANAYLGKTQKAIKFFEQHHAISIKIGDVRGESDALGNLGMAYAHLGNIKKSIDFSEQSLIIGRKIGDKLGESKALGNLGNASINLGETRKAIEYFEQALEIALEIGDRKGEENNLSCLGLAYYLLGEPHKAIEHCEQALKISRDISDPSGEGVPLFNMSLSLDKLGQRAEAIECARSALKIFEQIESPKAEQVRQQLAEWQK